MVRLDFNAIREPWQRALPLSSCYNCEKKSLGPAERICTDLKIAWTGDE